MESALCVLDAMFDVIDKSEYINEYDENNILSGIFMESMMIFMEAVSKDKDEITKWMVKKGYWYDGDNPKKKKECNRMYQFLKQHDFRPSDETYKTNIADGKNGKKRIKLTIDPNTLTKEDKEILKKGREEGEATLWLFDKGKHEVARQIQDHENSIKAGNNASFHPRSEQIEMGSKTLKGKQYRSQQRLKHEEGHADSWFKGNNDKYKNEDLPSDHPANITLKEHKKSGKFVNSHDNSTEELMADLYSAMNSQIRTKNWGKNKTTRKVTKSEIIKRFSDLVIQNEKECDEYFNKRFTNENIGIDQFKKYVKQHIDDWEGYWSRNKDSEKLDYFYKGERIERGWQRVSSLLINDVSDGFRKCIKVGGIGQVIDDDIHDAGSRSEDFAAYIKRINKNKERIKKYEIILKQVKDVFASHNIKSDSDLDKLKQSLLNSHDDDILDAIFNWTKTTEEVIEKINQCINDDKEAINRYESKINEMKKDPDQIIDKHIFRIIKFINEGSKRMLNNNFKFPENLLSQIVGEAQLIIEDMTKGLKKDNEQERAMWKRRARETNELRKKFAQIAIKEYFEEFINDYIYND